MIKEKPKELADKALEVLVEWCDNQRSSPGREPERYVICAGLAVIERMREIFPLHRKDYVTGKSQVKTSGALIQAILKRYGETRTYAREGGRTTRGTLTAAENLALRLNILQELASLSDQERDEVADVLQCWLVDRVREYFNRQKIEPEINLEKPGPQIVADILEAARFKNVSGAVAQHLVGAKLALRYPHVAVENYSYTTADQQLKRPGDFVIGDTAFHVTVAPLPAVLDKCASNIRHGYRAYLLVTATQMPAAVSMSETLGLRDKVGILPIEAFVGQNIEEMGEFKKENLASGIRALLETYNKRVEAIETDLSLLMEIPENL